MRQTEDASMLTYLHPYYHHADSIWSESWSPAPLAALLDFGHSSDLCDQAGHSSLKYITTITVIQWGLEATFILTLPSFHYQGGLF